MHQVSMVVVVVVLMEVVLGGVAEDLSADMGGVEVENVAGNLVMFVRWR